MSLEHRLDWLERHALRPRAIWEMSDSELAELATGLPGADPHDLSDDFLQAIVDGSDTPKTP
jgi:hypothetical protein